MRGRMVILGLGLTLFATSGGGLTNGTNHEPTGLESPGCKAAHLGVLGAMGLAVFSRAARSCDDVARVGLRSGDNLARLTTDLTPLSVLDAHWQEVSGIVGRMAVEGSDGLGRYPTLLARHPEVAAHLGDPAFISKYAADHPTFYDELGVEMYLIDPASWTAHGADDLLAIVAIRSPGFRGALREEAGRRFDQALTSLSHADDLSDQVVAELGQAHGVHIAVVGEDTVALEMRSADFVYRVTQNIVKELSKASIARDSIQEDAISERVRFDAQYAAIAVQEHIRPRYAFIRRSEFEDVSGLFAFKADDQTYFVGPGPMVFHGREDFPRLMRVLRAGGTDGALSINDFVRLFTSVYLGTIDLLLSPLLSDDVMGYSPPRVHHDEHGTRYLFWTSLDRRSWDVLVRPDGTVVVEDEAPNQTLQSQ
jgi:hypothetical protein